MYSIYEKCRCFFPSAQSGWLEVNFLSIARKLLPLGWFIRLRSLGTTRPLRENPKNPYPAKFIKLSPKDSNDSTALQSASGNPLLRPDFHLLGNHIEFHPGSPGFPTTWTSLGAKNDLLCVFRVI